MYRKFTLLFLLAALLLYPGNADAKYVTDSTALAQQTKLTSDISAPDIPVELGLIIPWNSVTNPPTFSPGGKYPKWADCDGRSIAGSDLCMERGICNTPNFKNKFLRASTDRIGQNFLDSLRSHNHEQPGHTHMVDTHLTSTAVTGRVDDVTTKGQLDSTDVSGIAAGQVVSVPHTSVAAAGTETVGFGYDVTWQAPVSSSTSTGGGGGGGHHAEPAPAHSHSLDLRSYAAGTVWEEVTANDSELVNAKVVNEKTTGKLVNDSTSGNVVNDHASGEAHEAGDDPTFYTSMYGSTRTNTTTQNNSTETAPEHQRVRYLS